MATAMTADRTAAAAAAKAASLESAYKEYGYAQAEIHLRLGFNRQVLNLQITLLAALIGGVVAFFDKHILSDIVIQVGAVAVMFLNLAFILEIRQNSLHTIVCGNFIVDRLMPAFPPSYVAATDGGLLRNIRRYRERGVSRKMLFHYWTDSFLLVSTLTLVAALGVLGWTLAVRPLDLWSVGSAGCALAALAGSVTNLWGYAIADPRFVRESMARDAAAHAAAEGQAHGPP
jgi:hypothetical protein